MSKKLKINGVEVKFRIYESENSIEMTVETEKSGGRYHVLQINDKGELQLHRFMDKSTGLSLDSLGSINVVDRRD